jgi:hypothetical protein
MNNSFKDYVLVVDDPNASEERGASILKIGANLSNYTASYPRGP